MAIPMLFSEVAFDKMMEYAAVSSETSDDHEERTSRMVDALLDAGLPEAEVTMAKDIEYLVRELSGEHERQAGETGSTQGVAAWAHEQLNVLDFAEAVDQSDLEAQIRAFAILANMSYEAASRIVNRCWLTSPAYTASAGSASQLQSGVRQSQQPSSQMRTLFSLSPSLPGGPTLDPPGEGPDQGRGMAGFMAATAPAPQVPVSGGGRSAGAAAGEPSERE